MAQKLKYLLHNPEDQSSDPHNPHKCRVGVEIHL